MLLVCLATRAIPDWPRVAVAYSREADTARPGQSSCSPGMLWPVTRGRYRLEWGRLGEMIYWRPSDTGHRLVTLLPVLNLRRRLPRLDKRRRRHEAVTASWTSSWCPPSKWGLKLGPRRSGSSSLTTLSPAWGRPQTHYQLGQWGLGSSPLTWQCYSHNPFTKFL